MKLQSRALFLFILIGGLFITSQAEPACIDTLDTLNCDQGSPSTWSYYSNSSSPFSLWDNVTCSGAGLHQCTCGETDTNSPCSGCPRQFYRTAGQCYELDCSTPCTPAPQFSSQAKMGCLVLSLLLALGGVRMWKRHAA